jgi:hypothetical protein
MFDAILPAGREDYQGGKIRRIAASLALDGGIGLG